MEAATKNKRGRPKKENAGIIKSLVYSLNETTRTAQNSYYACKGVRNIIQPFYPEAESLFLNPDNHKIKRQGVAEQLGRIAEEDPEQAIEYAGECIELINQGEKSKDIENALRKCRKRVKE